MNTFFPVAASNVGNGANPAPLDPATGQTTPFTQVLTATQAQMNPPMLVLLNGMAGLSPQITAENTPAIPAPQAEMPSEMPGQETTSAIPDANLLALAGVSMTPLVIPNAMPTIAPAPMQTTPKGSEIALVSSQMTARVPSVDVTAGQNTLLSGAEDIAVLVSQLQSALNTNTAQTVPQLATIAPQPGQNPNAITPTQQGTEYLTPQQANEPIVQQSNAPTPQLPNVPIPANTVQVMAQTVQMAVSTQQSTMTANGLSLVPNPSRQLETETTLAPNILAIVAEPILSGQNPAKQIAALPMNTERAIALPNMAIAPTASQNPTDTDDSAEGSDSHKTEILAAISSPAERAAQSAGAQTFGDTLQRLESTGRTSAANAEAVKPNPTDRFEVAAQVTKQLENLTATGGRNEMIIQLKPGHLGQIKITLSTSENGLSAKIVSDSVQAQTALNGAKESLRAAFEQRGLTLETLDVTLNQQAFGKEQQQAFAGMQMGYGQTHPQQMRTVLGDFTPEDDSEISATVAAVLARNSLNRLDFRA